VYRTTFGVLADARLASSSTRRDDARRFPGASSRRCNWSLIVVRKARSRRSVSSNIDVLRDGCGKPPPPRRTSSMARQRPRAGDARPSEELRCGPCRRSSCLSTRFLRSRFTSGPASYRQRSGHELDPRRGVAHEPAGGCRRPSSPRRVLSSVIVTCMFRWVTSITPFKFADSLNHCLIDG